MDLITLNLAQFGIDCVQALAEAPSAAPPEVDGPHQNRTDAGPRLGGVK